MRPKKQKAVSKKSLKMVNKININNCLDNDSLIRIFEYLPIKEKLKIEFVCKRWSEIGKFAWSNVKSFKLSQTILEERKNGRIVSFNLSQKVNFILNVIKRCGSYLNELCIINDLDEEDYLTDYTMLFTEISKYCHDITKLTLINCMFLPKFCSDEELSILFEANKKLSSITLNAITLNGNCFSSLAADSITEFNLFRCEFYYVNKHENLYVDYQPRLYHFLTKLKNLNIFNIEKTANLDKIFKALEESNCENMSELTLQADITGNVGDINVNNLIGLLSKQKKLLKLKIEKLEIDANLLQSLSNNSVEELDIVCNVPYYFNQFENLKVFDSKVEKLTDEFMKHLSGCLKLENIHLEVSNYELTSEGEYYFSKFQELTSFKFSFKEKDNIDNLLIALSQCKKLNLLDVSYCEFTSRGIESLNSLINLERLKLLSTSPVKKLEIINLIKKLINLKYINYKGPSNENLDLLEILNDVKENRGDKQALTLYFTVEREEYKELENFWDNGYLKSMYPFLKFTFVLDTFSQELRSLGEKLPNFFFM